MGFLKLVAGMLGVGLDDLVQRETTRRHRRLAWLAAGSLAGMAVTSGLAITAIQARDAARDQRREAEGLVAFMVGDLKDKLEPIGKLDALDGVGSRVLAYYSKQDTSELSDAALLQRSRALSITAQVSFLRGNFDQSDALYRQAMAGTAEAVRRSPDDPKRLFDHAQNAFWIGEIARFRGRNDQALTAYREYKRLADRLVAIEPDNLKWRMEGLYGVEDVGIALYNERQFAAAHRQFASALVPMQNLAKVEPGNLTYRKELAAVFAWLADSERAQGHLDSAIVLRQRQVALLSQAIASGVTDVDFRAQLIPAHQGLGVLYASRGQSARSIRELQSAVAVADGLIPIEPANSYWRTLAAAARLELASAFLSVGRPDEAVQQTQMGCALAASLKAAGPASARQVTCLIMRSRLALNSGASDEAVAVAQKALAAARAVHTDDPIKDRFAIATAYRLIGDAHRDRGDSEAAGTAWSNALAALPQGVPEMPTEMDEHATILTRLGRADDARRIAMQLNEMGYRHLS
jgi:tetratricopeptide (TPR) repeat protein